MTEKPAAILLSAALAALCHALPVYGAPAAERGPDIILIVIDTCRADHLSAYGYGRQTTPNINELARGGVLFRSAYSQTDWTLPSFASFLTGRYPRALGMFAAGKGLTGFEYPDPAFDPAAPTLPEELKKAGYRTAGFFTGRFNGPGYGFTRGFDLYRNYRNKSSDREGPVKPFSAFLPEAFKWMRKDRSKPFFVLLHSSELHRPYRAPADYVKKYDRGYKGALASTWLSRDVLSTIKNDGAGWSFAPDPAAAPVRLTDADMAYIKDRYDASLSYADSLVGKVAAWTRAPGRSDTVVIVMADHGEGLGDHGGVLHCTNPPRLYQELVHVPLVMAIPKKRLAAAAPAVDQPVELVDLMPTVLRLAGVRGPLPEGLQGRDLTGLLAGGDKADPGRPVFSETLGYGLAVQAVKAGPLKLIRTSRNGEPVSAELYDLDSDPSEEKDLAAQRPGDLKALQDKLDVWTAANEKYGTHR
jgi:arylsulfatase A-like enzyme